MIPATLACALACIALVIGEYRNDDRLRWIAKPIASAAFIVVGVIAATKAPRAGSIDAFTVAVVTGLVLGAIGDLALLSRHGFLAGLGAFLLGHLAYVVAVATRLSPWTWPGAAGVFALAPIGVGSIALAWLWPKLGRLRIPVIAYVAVILMMVIAALALLRAGSLDLQRRELFAVGAILFFASDLAVARDKFAAKEFINRAWGLPVYYAAQLLIAWSI